MVATPIRRRIMAVSWSNFHHVFRKTRGEGDPRCLQPVRKLGHDAGPTETTPYLPIGSQAIFVEDEQILHADDVAVGSREFGDMGDAAAAVAHAGGLDDD